MKTITVGFNTTVRQMT